MRLALCAALWCLCAAAFSQSPADSVRAFVEAWNRRDFKAAASYVSGASATKEMEAFGGGTWPQLQLANVTEKIDGEKARVTYRLSTSQPNGFPPHDEVLELARQHGKWIIVSRQPDAPDRGTRVLPSIAEYLRTPNVMALAKSAARKAQCLSNVKQLAIGVIMYLSDSKDVFTLKAADWRSKIQPYTRNAALATCPVDAKGAVSYSFNDALSGMKVTKLKDPAGTVLLYEGKNRALNFRHEGRAAVAFADGHAKFITRDQAKTLRWK